MKDMTTTRKQSLFFVDQILSEVDFEFSFWLFILFELNLKRICVITIY